MCAPSLPLMRSTWKCKGFLEILGCLCSETLQIPRCGSFFSLEQGPHINWGIPHLRRLPQPQQKADGLSDTGPTCKAVASSVQKGRSDTHKHTHDHSTIQDDTGLQDGPISNRLHLPSPLTRPLLPYAAVSAPRAPLPEILVSLAAAPWMAKGK